MSKLLKVLGQEYIVEILEFIQAHGKANFKDFKDLAKHPASISRALAKLRVEGLVRRRVLDDEKRSVEYYITEKGKKVITILKEIIELT